MIERERRWKLNGKLEDIPPDQIVDKYLIEQVYSHFKPDLRIRKITKQDIEEYFHCAKYYLEDGDREEVELKISKERYDRIFQSINKKPIIKERTIIDIGNGLFAEVDNYLDTDDIVVEVEFKNQEQKDNFSPLLWFGQEITNSKSFSYLVFAKLNNLNISLWD
jgi:CYTH domain-containing protein